VSSALNLQKNYISRFFLNHERSEQSLSLLLEVSTFQWKKFEVANIWEKAISILEGNLDLGRNYIITTVNHNTTNMHTVHHKELSYCKSKVMKVDFSWLSVAKNMTIWCRSHLPSSLHYGHNLQILSIFKFAKSQVILKSNCQAVNSSKKWRMHLFLLTCDVFSFVFWKKLKTPKRHFEIIWPLVPCSCVGWSINYVVWKLVISLSRDNFLDNLDTFQSWFNLASFRMIMVPSQ
jgi:hypothetical protein